MRRKTKQEFPGDGRVPALTERTLNRIRRSERGRVPNGVIVSVIHDVLVRSGRIDRKHKVCGTFNQICVASSETAVVSMLKPRGRSPSGIYPKKILKKILSSLDGVLTVMLLSFLAK